METNNNNIYSFFQLLENQEKIEIPIIQRDYAQGREDKSEIRDNFLTALETSINAQQPIQLDFIYGSKVDKSFQPLDGQQRLTTLFLLHWYASVKDQVPEEQTRKLKKFSYETRITSREFCNSLVENSVDINNDEKISDKIRDSKWFFLSWNHDPTIDAMLRSIDDINLKFKHVDNLWSKLVAQNLISFYYVELDEIGLTDDLYIKMNARGKLLSPFENFKASFEKRIEDNNWEVDKLQLNKFAFKIDTDWTDYFWKHFRKNNTIDNSLMKFMSALIMVRASLERRADRIALIYQLNDNYNSLKPNHISEKSYEYIYSCFQLYSDFEDFEILKIDIPFYRHTPLQNFFDEVVSMDASSSYTQKVYFYALTEYLLRNGTDNRERLIDWMRVIRNILSRGSVEKGGNRPDIIRSPETFDGVINLISELAEGSDDIYSFLANKEKLNSTFAKDQIEEELTKSKIVILNDDYKSSINLMEDLNFFKGRISFGLNCIEYDGNPNNFNKNNFDDVRNVIKQYFDDENSDKISNDIRRGLLTIEVNGFYNFYGYWWSYWYVGDANKRCLIDNYRELEYYIYNTEYSPYLKKLILQLIGSDIKKIIEDFQPPVDMPNWKVRLIKDSDLLDKKSKSNYIAISPDEKFCYLLKSKRPRDTKGCNKII
ncbi:DUF262 domain-containing protein [Chryseobacterium contaminans]|uniref:DUF262 domain-containing protein n=1 Tax=Chryseobacterium contaminans TaxID=1423959 RepID=UPI0030166DDD